MFGEKVVGTVKRYFQNLLFYATARIYPNGIILNDD